MSRVRRAVWTTAFLLALALTASMASSGARAQPAGKVPRIGVIGEGSPAVDTLVVAFQAGLRELGYVEGQSLIVQARYAHNNPARYPELATELIREKVDVLVVGGTTAAQAARAQTATVPIVFTLAGDPVGSGLVASLARPGGNVTGMSNLASDLGGKQLELLKTALPKLSRVAVMHNPTNPASRSTVKGARETARALGMELVVLEVRQASERAGAFAQARGAGAVLIVGDVILASNPTVKLAMENRLPAIFASRPYAEAGAFMSYGPSFHDNWRRAATYVDKILKGARPGDLPVEQPSKLELVVNLRTAKTLGLTLPPSLIQRADQVIQ